MVLALLLAVRITLAFSEANIGGEQPNKLNKYILPIHNDSPDLPTRAHTGTYVGIRIRGSMQAHLHLRILL